MFPSSNYTVSGGLAQLLKSTSYASRGPGLVPSSNMLAHKCQGIQCSFLASTSTRHACSTQICMKAEHLAHKIKICNLHNQKVKQNIGTRELEEKNWSTVRETLNYTFVGLIFSTHSVVMCVPVILPSPTSAAFPQRVCVCLSLWLTPLNSLENFHPPVMTNILESSV